jgi:uncharacterized protein (DUF983 family)
MAWFDPPLYKPGNKRCPSCGNPVWWASLWSLWNGSSTYLCSRCGADLKVAVGRSILGWVLPAAFFSLWLWSISIDPPPPEWAGAPFMYGGILLLILAQWWFTSVGLSEKVPLEQTAWRNPPLYKPGNKRCPSCRAPVRQESMGYLWSTRNCTQCGVALRHNVHRAIVGMVPSAILIAALLAAILWRLFNWRPESQWWVFFLMIPISWLYSWFYQWWFVSIKLDEKAASNLRSS